MTYDGKKDKDELKRTNVNISERDKEKARKIGGDVSKGLRKALEKYDLRRR